jgi:hypothetical protein
MNYYLKHNYHIFVLHCPSNNTTYDNMRSHYHHWGSLLNHLYRHLTEACNIRSAKMFVTHCRRPDLKTDKMQRGLIIRRLHAGTRYWAERD